MRALRWSLLAAALLGIATLVVWRLSRPGAPVARTAPAGRDLRTGLPAWARDPDAAAGAVAGLVKSPAGQPVAGALVAIIPELETTSADARIKAAGTARSGADGRFVIPNLRPGEYAATATAEGFAGGHHGGLVVLPGETLPGVEIVLEAGGVALGGRVGDTGGGPIAGAELRAFAGVSGRRLGHMFQVTTDSAGAYHILLPRDQYLLVADADGYAPSSRMVDTAAVQKADFLLAPAARLAGRVVARSSRDSVPEATVVLESEQIWWQAPREARSDGEGRFEFRDLDPGAYRLSGHKGRLVGAAAQPVDIAIATRTAEATVELDAGLSVSGRVTGGPGTPVSGARVRLGANAFGVGARVRAVAEADGRYRVEGVLPGKYHVSAEARGRAPGSRDVVVSGQDLTDVDLALPGEALVVGQVLGSDGAAAPGITVSALVLEVAASAWAGSSATDRTDRDGRFKLTGLSAGKVRVSAEDPDRGLASFGPEAIAAGETKTVTLHLEAGGSVSGIVSWEEGGPAEGASVFGMSGDATGMVQTKTGPDGSYRLAPLRAGHVIVIASRQAGYAALLQVEMRGAAKRTQTIELAVNERRRGVDLAIEKGGHKVTGVVLSPDGKPLAGASVGADRDNMFGGMRAAMGSILGEQNALSGEDGTFTVEDLAAGPYTVWAKMAGRPEVRVAKVPTDARGVKVQFAAEAVLAGVAVDAAGKPVTDFAIAAVEAAGGDDPARAAARMTQSVTAMLGMGRQEVHDASGAFELHGLGAGKYDVLVTTGDGRVGKAAGVTAAAGQRKADLRVLVKAGALAHGKVVELVSDKPVPGIPVLLIDAEQPRMQATNADGTFRMDGLAGGRTLHITVASPNSEFVPDVFEVTLPPDRTDVDLGAFKLVRGTMDRPGDFDGGLGLVCGVKGRQPQIVQVFDHTPAAEANLKKGDIIRTIEGQEVAGVGEGGLRHLLGGAPGSAVNLGVVSGQQPRTVRLVRRASGKASPPQTSQAPVQTPR